MNTAQPNNAYTAGSNAAATALTPEQLRWRCDPATLGFATTNDLPPPAGVLGQQRGVDALALGLALDTSGFHVYVAGPPGSGRASTVRAMVSDAAATGPSAADWCYLHNFSQPAEPIAVQLPSGAGPRLERDLTDLVANLRRELARVFETEQYRQRRADIERKMAEERSALFDGVNQLAERLGFAVDITDSGVVTVPLLEPGKPMTEEAFRLLPDEKQAELRGKMREIMLKTEEVMVSVRGIQRDSQERLHALDQEVVGFAVGHLLDALRRQYASVPQIIQHLDAVQTDLVEHVDELRSTEADRADRSAPPWQAPFNYDRYRANVLVTHDPADGAPVVLEPNPTYYNLLGRVDYRASMSAMLTDFRMIRAGALHRANGGYLVLQARDVLVSPYAWDALKRALRERELRIENLGEQFSAIPTSTLKPASIPLHVKVVLIGDLQTYSLLHQLDPDFPRLFKIKAQFEPDMPRSTDTLHGLASFIGGYVDEHALMPFGADAVARVIEHATRLAEHQERLAAQLETIGDLLAEADFHARHDGSKQVAAAHVQQALDAQDHRLSLLEDRLQREILENTIDIDTHREVVGQVNALSVFELEDYAFARPTRITAQVGLGEEGVVDIEHEVKLSGPSHSKGVLTLSGYLLGHYGQTTPLALSARLTFEQTYSAVDGDSASSTELCALLSALAELPIRQGIAVTGSVNQRGEIQAIGAVTTKIEGFFAVCKAQGLDGRQGVIIPRSNIRHLMLKQEILDAVAAARFHVWAVGSVDEGIQLLTGVPASRVHALVQNRLIALAERLSAFRKTGTARKPRLAHNGVVHA